ncbi:MAG: nuclear transport factor 2 family protein [Rubricoccaceae bacterium]|nr:nuclear transport factor 2 family protein [Rubricoccaceae bacterium]
MPSTALAQSQTETEVMETIHESNDYVNANLRDAADYSMHGALEFWSSGGLLQEIPPEGRPDVYDAINVQAKHIRVLPLVEGEVAVAHYYLEGSLAPKGAAPVGHYLARVTQVFVKEDGAWKIRSSHWSPIAGGSGTSQTTLND